MVSQVKKLTRLIRREIDFYLFLLSKPFAVLLLIFVRFFGSDREGKNIILLPPDDCGSIGDEAMFFAVLPYLRDAGFKEIGVITYTDNAPSRVACSDVVDYPVWPGFLGVFRFVMKLRQYDVFCCFGADVMDGYYSSYDTCKRLFYMNLAKKMGLRVILWGFSFNSTPSARASRSWKSLDPDIKLYSRDPVSCDRLEKLIGRSVNLVADLAFMLKPSKSAKTVAVSEWIEGQKSLGRVVVGFNVNPFLILGGEGDVQYNLASSVAFAINEIIKKARVSVVLIPHDYRGSENDFTMLKIVYDLIDVNFIDMVYFSEDPLRASEIKELCSYLDIVITGRMHLAIAALGSGVPVAGLTYQGKFEGLMMHFGIPSNMLIDPKTASDSRKFACFVEKVVGEVAALRKIVDLNLPLVRKLSLKNFETFLD